MKTTIAAAALAAFINLSLAAPQAPQSSESTEFIPINNVPENTSCITTAGSNTWNQTELLHNLPKISKSNDPIYFDFHKTEYFSTWGSPHTDGAIGPSPEHGHPFLTLGGGYCGLEMNQRSGLEYVKLTHLEAGALQTSDVALYTRLRNPSQVWFCGVMTNSDNKTPDGYHLCNEDK